jgi:hypothetical protein
MRWQATGRIASVAAMAVLTMMAAATAAAQAGTSAVLKIADAQKMIPASVFYDGQQATTQLRNAGAIQLADGHHVLAVLVDNGGYSTGVAAKYQAYFVTEDPIRIGAQRLAAGVYGMGFVAGSKLVVTDVGAHDVLTVPSVKDTEIKRPMPLQFTANPGGGFRFYCGRQYVTLTQ